MDPVGYCQQLRFVRCAHDRAAASRLRDQKLGDAPGEALIELRGRFIEQDDIRLACERAHDRGPLSLAARQGADRSSAKFDHTDRLEVAVDGRCAFGIDDAAAHGARELDVFADRHRLRKARRGCGDGDRCGRVALQVADVGRRVAGDQAEQGGLARSGPTGHDEQLAGAHAQCDRREDFYVADAAPGSADGDEVPAPEWIAGSGGVAGSGGLRRHRGVGGVQLQRRPLPDNGAGGDTGPNPVGLW